MRKSTAFIVSVAMILSMVASMSFVAAPDGSGKSQFGIVSIKAVDVATAVTGIRAYNDLADSKHGYQQGDPIYLSLTVEVKNIGKTANAGLKSIADVSTDVIIGSDDIDLSYSNYTAPVVVSYIHNGYTSQPVGTYAAESLNVGSVTKYDKSKNEVSMTFRGSELNRTGGSSAIAVGAKVNSSGEIVVPALKAKDGKTNVIIDGSTYTYPYEAPDALTYSVLISGVTKSGTATKGDYYAQMVNSAAEKFTSYGSYYVDKNGKVTDSAPNGTEYVDYIKVPIEKLSIDGKYNVYKYTVPASGLYDVSVNILYKGEHSSSKDALIAKVNPNLYDNSTSKGQTKSGVAGGVRSLKAYKVNDGSKPVENVPATSIVYTSKASYYAPTFYSGILNKTTKVYGEREVPMTFKKGTAVVSDNRDLVQSFKGVLEYDRNIVKEGLSVLNDVEISAGDNAVNSKGAKIYSTYEKAYAAWQAEKDAKSIPSFDAKLYPYISMYSSSNAANAIATYKVVQLSGENTKLQIDLTVKGGKEEEAAAATSWTPVITGKNVFGKGVTGTADMSVSAKSTEKVSRNADAYVSTLKEPLPLEELTFYVTDSKGTPLTKAGDAPKPGEYKVYTTEYKGAVTTLTILPIADAAGNLPPWCATGTDVVAWYPGGEDNKTPNVTPTGPISVRATFIDPNGDPSDGDSTITSVEPAGYTLMSDVVDRNGIAVYLITDPNDDKPVVALATEDMYFESESGSSIATFDSINGTAKRIMYSNANNFAYVEGSEGNVPNSDKIVSAFKSFGLDTGFSTTSKLTDSSFESKGAAAQYSEKVFGEFSYGRLIVEVDTDEFTEEDEVEPIDPEEIPEEEDEVLPGDKDDGEETGTDVPSDDIPKPQTGDFSGGSAAMMLGGALAAAALLALTIIRSKKASSK